MRRILFTVLVLGVAAVPVAAFASHPVIPGLSRDGLDPRLRGLVLLGELGCVACHSAGPLNDLIHTKTAPDLSAVGERVNPEYLKAFIANPRQVKPGTTMPDVFGTSDEQTRQATADALTHYLVSLGPQGFSLQAPDRVAATRGQELFHSIGCVACHSPRDEDGNELVGEGSVPLGRLDQKYSVKTLAEFLEAPHRVRPSGRMPGLHLTSAQAYQLANYLTSATRVPGPLHYTLFLERMEEGPDRLEGKEHEAGLAEGFSLERVGHYRDDFALRFQGFLQIATAGEYTFTLDCSHVARLTIGGQRVISLAKSGSQESKVSLAPGLHSIDLVYLHVRGEPRLDLQMSGPGIERGLVPASMLRSEKTLPARYMPFSVDAAKAAMGKVLFGGLNCIRCHQIEPPGPGQMPPALAALRPLEGCLSEKIGGSPAFELSERQQKEIRSALADLSFVPTPEQKIRKTLAALNCIACHKRGEWGGVTKARDDYYRSIDPNLGEPGRLPPALTGVGAKLKLDWLRDTLADGQSIRPYMLMRMPAFGEEGTAQLADLLGEVDQLPAVTFEPLPRGRQGARAVKDIGRGLVGNPGMDCITCHPFRGQGTSSMAAVDLVETTTKRLKKDWFYHYMLNPARFRSTTIMPQYFPGGVSVLKDVAEGDPKKQLNAMWLYLADGRNTRSPNGLKTPTMEIVVEREAVILRRSVQNTGKRGISVGYPLKVHLTFDAESVSLNQIWRGRFIDPARVWGGQGNGEARIISRDRIDLGKGPAFAELADATAPWPNETSRSLGGRFKGYVLDEQRRPTFRYVYEGVTIADKPVDLHDENGGGPFLHRTLTLRSPEDKTLYFRALVHSAIKDLGGGMVAIGEVATIRASGSSGGSAALAPLALQVRPSTQGEEVVVPVQIREGKAILVLEYRWLEKIE